MLSANERITPRQFQILFILEAFGTGFIVMPRLAANYAGQDGWLVALLLILPGLLFVAMVSGIAKNFGNEPFALYLRRLLGSPLSAVICFVLWAKILFCAGLELSIFGGIVQAMLLNRTPPWVVYIVILAVAAYAAAKGIETRARLAEILIIVIAIPLFVLGILALFNIDFGNLQPALVTPPQDLAKGVLSLGFIFTGIEFIFIAVPYLNKPQEGQRAALNAMAIAGIVMVIITAFTLAKFGPYNTQALDWPVLKMMDMINVPGSLVARQEALVLSFWMLSVFAFMAASVFYGAALGRDQTNIGKHKWWVVASAVIICLVAMYPISRNDAYMLLNKIFFTFGLGFWVGLPILMFIVKMFRKNFSVLLILLLTVSLTGCFDSVEIENRAFAVAFGVDSTEEGRYQFSTAIAQLENDKGGDSNEDNAPVRNIAEGDTLIEAKHNLDAQLSRNLFLGQAKTVVFGKQLLENREMFRQALHVIESNNSLDRTITVLATDDNVTEILNAHPPEETKPGYYVVNFYRLAPKSGGRLFQKNFERMMSDLRETGNVLLPKIDAQVEGGAFVVKDYSLAGELDGDQLRGLMWSKSKACEGAVLTVDNIPIVVKRHKASLRFSEGVQGKLRCIVDVRINGELNHFNKPDMQQYEQIIAQEISQSFAKLQQELEVDATNLKRALRRQQYGLYQRYVDDWEDVFRDMEVFALVRVHLT